MQTFLGGIFSSKHDLYASQPSQRLKTEHLIQRISRHNKLNLSLMLIALFMVGLFGFLGVRYLNSPSQNILGLTKTDPSPQVPAPTQEPITIQAIAACRQAGGSTIQQNLDTAGQITICRFPDGTECDALIVLQQGSCPVTNFDPGPALSSEFVFIPTPLPSQPVSIDQQYLYYLTLVKKPDAIDPVEPGLIHHLAQALDLEKPYPFTGLYYDTRQGNPFDQDHGGKYNFSYYLVADRPLTSAQTTLSTYALDIAISPAGSGILELLQNPQACRFDQDCLIRDHFCTTSAFNPYHPYRDGWTCAAKVDIHNNSLIFYDQDKSCKATKVFTDPTCIDNLCVIGNTLSACLE